MTKQKTVIKILDLKPKKNSESQSEVLIGQSFSKRLWEGRFNRLCGDLLGSLGRKGKKK